jgi:hypothetical protein
MDGKRTNSVDQQFISFNDYDDQSAGTSAQMHVDLGMPNQQLFGHLQSDPAGTGMMQDLHGFPDQKDGNNVFYLYCRLVYYFEFYFSRLLSLFIHYIIKSINFLVVNTKMRVILAILSSCLLYIYNSICF